MNAAHFHLALNHFPVVFPFAALVLFLARQRKAALLLCVVGGLLVLPAYFTGEPTEDMVEKLPGYSHDLINAHEEMAERALICGLALALVAAAALWRERKGGTPPAWIYWGPIALLLFTGGAMIYTSFVGGKIHHDEIRSAP
jgi:hypothetical protein